MSHSNQSAAEHELQIGRSIQNSFLPDVLPQPKGWEVVARFRPARQVAGDFYDAFPLVNNRRVGLVIADVCDKGVGAALYMALFRTLIRAFAQQHYALSWTDALDTKAPANPTGGRRALPSVGTNALRNAISLTNDYILNNHAATGMFVTVFFGLLDPATGALAYINAGHNPPLVLGSEGVKETLPVTGPAIGILPDMEWKIGQTTLQPGDTLLTYTDGITEARNGDGAFYGEERLEALAARPLSSGTELLTAIEADVLAFVSGADQYDDITLLAVRRGDTGTSGDAPVV